MQIFETKAAEGLEKLNLTTALAQFDTAAQTASAENWSYTHFLGYLLDGELTERHRRTVEMSLQFARFPVLKRLTDFDYAAQPSVDRRLIEELDRQILERGQKHHLSGTARSRENAPGNRFGSQYGGTRTPRLFHECHRLSEKTGQSDE